MDTRPAIARSTPADPTPAAGSWVSTVPADEAAGRHEAVGHRVGGLRRLSWRLGSRRGRSRGHRRPAAPSEGRWVAAAVTDDLDAVEVARVARGLASEGDGRLLLLVPQPAGGFTTEPMLSVMMQRRREEAAVAIVGRILPVLEDSAAPLREVRTQVVPHGSVSWAGRRPDGELGSGSVVGAVLSAARRAGADVLVAPAAMLPGRTPDGRPALVDVARRRVIPAGDTPPGAPATTGPTDVEVAPPAAATR